MGITVNPRKIIGAWDEGYSLDVHTLSSTPIGCNTAGHLQFDTKRSSLGELIYRLKYRSDITPLQPIAETVNEFLVKWGVKPDFMVAVPPSNPRRYQPVFEIAKRVSKMSGIPLNENCLRKTKRTGQLKDVKDASEKAALLKDAFEVSAGEILGKQILVFGGNDEYNC